MTVDVDSLVCEDRVHGSVYTDPAIYDEEIDRIFHRGWVYVAHASEIPSPGELSGRESADSR